MLKYILKRLFSLVVVFIIIFILMYFCFSYANIEQYSHGILFWDVKDLILDNFITFVTNIIKFNDWGVFEDEPIWDLVFYRSHYTFKITLSALLFFTFGGILLGVVTALKRNTWIDKVINGFTFVFGSIPSYVMVWLLMLTLGWGLQILPAIYPAATTNPIEAILGLVIPVLSLAVWPLSKITQLIRGEIIDSLDDDYVLLCRTKGLSQLRVVRKHILKNVMVVALPEISTSFLFVLSSTFLIEIVYNINGMANLFYDSMIMPYYGMASVYFIIPITMLITSVYLVLGMIVSFIVDIVHALIDPRIRIGSNKYNK